MTEKEVVYTVLIGTTAIFIAVFVFLIFFVRAYNKKYKEKTNVDSIISEIRFDGSQVETAREPFCRCLHEIENNYERTKFCSHPCRDQMRILKSRNTKN